MWWWCGELSLCNFLPLLTVTICHYYKFILHDASHTIYHLWWLRSHSGRPFSHLAAPCHWQQISTARPTNPLKPTAPYRDNWQKWQTLCYHRQIRKYTSLNIITNSTLAPQTCCKRDLVSHCFHWHWLLYCITLYYIGSLIIVSNLMMAKSEMAETCSWYVTQKLQI